MRIREATRADGKWILHHRLGMFRAMGESEEFAKETAELTQEYLNGDWTSDYRYFLVEQDGEVIGGCGLSIFRIPPMAYQKAGLYAYLSNMYIERELQGKGYGRALVKHVVEVCKRENIGIIILHASAQSLHLYESEGFRSPNSLMHLIAGKHPTTWNTTGH
jgi:GNAT superfamily N-acetyltransferase